MTDDEDKPIQFDDEGHAILLSISDEEARHIKEKTVCGLIDTQLTSKGARRLIDKLVEVMNEDAGRDSRDALSALTSLLGVSLHLAARDPRHIPAIAAAMMEVAGNYAMFRALNDAEEAEKATKH